MWPQIERTLDLACEALKAGNIDGSWKQFQAAQRLELMCLDGVELNKIAVTMRAEVDKLNPWRKKAVTDLLSVEKGNYPNSINVVQAAFLRDEHYANEAYKDGLRRATTLWLASSLLLGLVALLGLAWDGTFDQLLQKPATPGNENLIAALAGMAVMGYLGATISAITKSQQKDVPARIPEMISSIRVTTLRLFVGPVSAIVIYFTVRSSLYEQVLKFGTPDGYALLVLAFIAGFTERLILRVVEGVAGKNSS